MNKISMQSSPGLSIVIPCFNEKENIVLLVNKFSKILWDSEVERYRNDIEIVFVDNGSEDGSEIIFREVLKDCTYAKLVRIDQNKGYGFGIYQGLQIASKEYVGWTHADLQTDPSDVIKALDIIISEGSTKRIYIKGSRYGRSLGDLIFTIGMSIFDSTIFRMKLTDINAQPNICHRKFINLSPQPPNDFSFDLYYYALAKKLNLRIRRFNVLFSPRQYGESKWNTSITSKCRFIIRTISFSMDLLSYFGRKDGEIYKMKSQIKRWDSA